MATKKKSTTKNSLPFKLSKKEGTLEYGKLEVSFHVVYFDFVSTINLLNFISNTIPDFYDDYFENWKKSIKSTISKLNKNDKKQYDEFEHKIFKPLRSGKNPKIKKMIFGDETKKIITELEFFAFCKIQSTATIREMILISLITYFEEFVKDSLRIIFNKDKRTLKSSKQLAFHDIIDSQDMKELQEKMIEKEIDDLLEENIDAVIDYLNKKFNLKLLKHESLKDFKERFYRRNVLIHNDGIPDDIYFEKTGKTKNDEMLFVEQNYLKNSFELFDNIAHALTDKFEIKFGVKKFDHKKSTFQNPISHFLNHLNDF